MQGAGGSKSIGRRLRGKRVPNALGILWRTVLRGNQPPNPPGVLRRQCLRGLNVRAFSRQVFTSLDDVKIKQFIGKNGIINEFKNGDIQFKKLDFTFNDRDYILKNY